MTDQETLNRQVDALISRARYDGPTVTAGQLVGLDACLRQLGGQLALIARPELAERFGLEPSGTLLIGPPGTGKTTVARFLAGRLDLPLYQLSADEFGSDPDLLHGVVRRLATERAILFIDEISILAQRREWASDAEERRMLAALLTSLDGLNNDRVRGRLWVIGACTADIQLDPAIHRSGRLGVVVEFAHPSEEQRRALLDLYLAGVPHTISEEELDRLAEAAVGSTGADIRDWVSQAASEVLAEMTTTDPVIEYRHLETVVGRRGFIAAEGRPGREPTWEDAVHESAHAIAALRLFGLDSLAKVSIGFSNAPGSLDAFARGHTTLSDDWSRANPPTSATWQDHAVYSLAGAAAEQILLGYRGGGAERDVSAATDRILDQLDVADLDFGPARRAVEGSIDGHRGSVGSEAMRAHAWSLTRVRFADCWQRSLDLVNDHLAEIERVARALLDEKGTLTGEEVASTVGMA